MLADAAAVEVALDPIRASILDALTEPGSAATVAAAVGSTRQKVNYHLKALEAHGLVELAEERLWGGITERFVRRSARHLVVAPDVLQGAALDPNEVADRLSAAYLIAVNARTVSEVGAIASSTATGTRLPTLTVDTVIRFRSPDDRAASPPTCSQPSLRWSPDPPRRRATAPSDRLVISPSQGALVTNPDQPDRVEHRVEHTYEVAATPEQVWDAIATADGISSWMVPTRLDPQIGGEVSFDLGGFTSTGVVTDYTPNVRFAYEEPWPIADHVEAMPASMVEWFNAIGVPLSEVHRDLSSVTPIATEFLIHSGSGGSCVIRVVTSAYGSGADWENEFFTEMVAGWGTILDNLATHLNKAT